MEILIPRGFNTQHDLAYALEETCRKRLTEIIELKKKKARYFILIVFNLLPTGVLNWKFILSDRKPPHMLGTICYRVDNIKGELFREWVLPKDMPLPAVDGPQDNPNGRLSGWNCADDAQIARIPIIYG